MPSLDTIRRSMLKTEIQASLLQEPARSITELAERVQSPRPSVSRALKVLREQRIVERRGRTWHLTAKGEDSAREDMQAHIVSASETAAAMARKMLSAQVLGASVFDQVRDAYLGSMSDLLAYDSASIANYQALLTPSVDSSMLDAALGYSLDSARAMMGDFGLTAEATAAATFGPYVAEELATSSFAGLAAASGLELIVATMPSGLVADVGVASPLAASVLATESAATDVLGRAALAEHSLGDALEATMAGGLVPDLGALISPVVSAQGHLAACLSAISSLPNSFPMDSLVDQTLAFATMLENATALDSIDSYLAAEGRIQELSDIAWVPQQLLAVNGAFGRLYESEAAMLQEPIESTRQFPYDLAWTLAAEPVSDYSLSTRYLIESRADYEVKRVCSVRKSEERHLLDRDEELDTQLRMLNPSLVEMRQGGWFAIERGGPDYLRHAGISHREFMDQLLRQLVPSEMLPEGERQGAQIKPRMRRILGGSESSAEYVNAMVNALYFTYQKFNSATHGTTDKNEASLRALMKATEGLIEFILADLDPEQLH